MKKSKNSKALKKIYRIYLFIATGVVTLWLSAVLFFQVFAWLHPAKVTQTQSKEEATKGLQQILDSFNAPGRIVLSRLVDDKCGTAELFGAWDCSLTADKYFVADGDMTTDMNIAKSKIDEIINNSQLTYLGRKLPLQTINVYSPETKTVDSYLGDLVREGIIETPKPGTFIYGTHITIAYYSCYRENLLFSGTCPNPR